MPELSLADLREELKSFQFQYPVKTRMTAKFKATESARIIEHVTKTLAAMGCTAESVEGEPVKGGRGQIYAQATIANGSGPVEVQTVLDALKAVSIRCTPVIDTPAGPGERFSRRSFTIFQPSDSWTVTAALAE